MTSKLRKYTSTTRSSAIIGVMVLKFGVVVGFVVFGIGGLIRFRTDLGSATKTGRLIFVTLVGLSCGLNLPHFAVLATAFGFGLIYVLDARMTFRIEVKDLDEEALTKADGVYTRVLEENGCRVVTTKRSFSKGEFTAIFRAPHSLTRDVLERIFERDVPRSLRSVVDWHVGAKCTRVHRTPPSDSRGLRGKHVPSCKVGRILTGREVPSDIHTAGDLTPEIEAIV